MPRLSHSNRPNPLRGFDNRSAAQPSSLAGEAMTLQPPDRRRADGRLATSIAIGSGLAPPSDGSSSGQGVRSFLLLGGEVARVVGEETALRYLDVSVPTWLVELGSWAARRSSSGAEPTGCAERRQLWSTDAQSAQWIEELLGEVAPRGARLGTPELANRLICARAGNLSGISGTAALPPGLDLETILRLASRAEHHLSVVPIGHSDRGLEYLLSFLEPERERPVWSGSVAPGRLTDLAQAFRSEGRRLPATLETAIEHDTAAHRSGPVSLSSEATAPDR